MHIHHATHCPFQSSAEPGTSLAFDRERLQSLIDLLARYDLSSDEHAVDDLSVQLRASGHLQA